MMALRRHTRGGLTVAVVLALVVLERMRVVSSSTAALWLSFVMLAYVVTRITSKLPELATCVVIDVAYCAAAALLVATHVADWSTARDAGLCLVAGTIGQALAPLSERRRLRRVSANGRPLDPLAAAVERNRERLPSV
jgi:hypothetical protein